MYCAEDPLVAIAEGTYYQALNWQKEIASSRTKAVKYPLRSEHLLWGFRIDPSPSVIDMESPLERSEIKIEFLVFQVLQVIVSERS